MNFKITPRNWGKYALIALFALMIAGVAMPAPVHAASAPEAPEQQGYCSPNGDGTYYCQAPSQGALIGGQMGQTYNDLRFSYDSAVRAANRTVYNTSREYLGGAIPDAVNGAVSGAYSTYNQYYGSVLGSAGAVYQGHAAYSQYYGVQEPYLPSGPTGWVDNATGYSTQNCGYNTAGQWVCW